MDICATFINVLTYSFISNPTFFEQKQPCSIDHCEVERPHKHISEVLLSADSDNAYPQHFKFLSTYYPENMSESMESTIRLSDDIYSICVKPENITGTVSNDCEHHLCLYYFTDAVLQLNLYSFLSNAVIVRKEWDCVVAGSRTTIICEPTASGEAGASNKNSLLKVHVIYMYFSYCSSLGCHRFSSLKYIFASLRLTPFIIFLSPTIYMC